MAVSKKGMRQVTYKGKHYYWKVDERVPNVPVEGFVHQAGTERLLTVVSADKGFIVHYRFPVADEPEAVLRVEGPRFPRAPGKAIVSVPRWRHDTKRYPTADFVRRLIDWCMTAG